MMPFDYRDPSYRQEGPKLVQRVMPLPSIFLAGGDEGGVNVKMRVMCKPLALILPMNVAPEVDVKKIIAGSKALILGDSPCPGSLFATGNAILDIDWPRLDPSEHVHVTYINVSPKALLVRGILLLAVVS